jgi:hypothetical protein
MCKLWKSSIVLQLFVVTTCKWSINSFTNRYPVYSHTLIHMTLPSASRMRIIIAHISLSAFVYVVCISCSTLPVPKRLSRLFKLLITPELFVSTKSPKRTFMLSKMWFTSCRLILLTLSIRVFHPDILDLIAKSGSGNFLFIIVSASATQTGSFLGDKVPGAWSWILTSI